MDGRFGRDRKSAEAAVQQIRSQGLLYTRFRTYPTQECAAAVAPLAPSQAFLLEVLAAQIAQHPYRPLL